MNKYLLNVLLFTTCCLWGVMAHAQSSKFVPVTDPQELRKLMEQMQQASQSIEADFVQEKKIDILEQVILSKGKFYFKQKDKLRLEYTSPSYYLVVMAAGKMLIKDAGQKTKIDAKGSKMFAQIQQVMTSLLGGQLNASKDFRYEVYKNDAYYKIRLLPQAGAVKELLKEVEFVSHKSNLKAASMTMLEQSGDVTLMTFKNVKTNQPIDDQVFATH